MGQSSSSEASTLSMEERELESQAASTGSLPLLKNSFSKLSDPTSNSIPLSALQVLISSYPFAFILNLYLFDSHIVLLLSFSYDVLCLIY